MISIRNLNFVFLDAERSFKFKIPEINNKIKENRLQILIRCDNDKLNGKITFISFVQYFEEYIFKIRKFK